MSTISQIEELVKQVINRLPPGLEEFKDEAKKNLHAGLASALQKMELVNREEYDIQTALLERLRQQITELQARLDKYEKDTSSKK